MKITYRDDKTKKYVYSWLKSCTDPFVAYKIKDTEILRPNQIMVNKNQLLKRVISETNCFNEDIDLSLGLDYDERKSPFLNFMTSEGEVGTMNLYFASFDGGVGISITQGDEKRVFDYKYNGNPAFYNGNLLEEYIPEEKRKNTR